MTNMKVYLRVGSLPIYKYLVKFPPKGVIYSASNFTTNKFNILTKIKRIFWKEYTKFFPPAIKIDIGNNDLIHSCYGMMILNKAPYVIDVEHFASFANFNISSLNHHFYRNKIISLLSSNYCKKIMPWTFAAKKSIENYFKNRKINEKLEVVYPAIEPPKIKKKKSNETIKLLVVSRFFYEKGGMQALYVFDILKKKYDVKLTVISNAPPEVKRKYKDVNFIYPNLTVDELFKNHYSKSDILLHLTFADTFGSVLLESMACRLPIVGTDMFAMPEIIEDGKNGFLIKSPFCVINKDYNIIYHQSLGNWNIFLNGTKKYYPNFTKEVVEKISLLIEDNKLRKQIGKNCLHIVKSGKFSIKERNKKLKKIYEESQKI